MPYSHAKNYPMHRFTVTFGDYIINAAAAGVIGSGTASLALRLLRCVGSP